MSGKIEGGLNIVAHQRENPNNGVPVSERNICTGNGGELIVSSAVGDARGIRVKATISLEEILAWLPEMLDKNRKFSTDKARQKIAEELRQEGVIITTSPKTKVLSLRKVERKSTAE